MCPRGRPRGLGVLKDSPLIETLALLQAPTTSSPSKMTNFFKIQDKHKLERNKTHYNFLSSGTVKYVICMCGVLRQYGVKLPFSLLILFYTEDLTNAFYNRGGGDTPYLTPKLNVMETPNLGCGLMFTTIFQKSFF